MVPSQRAWSLPTLLTCSLLCLTSCDRGGEMEAPETLYGSALETDRFRPELIPDPGVRTRPDELAQLQPVVDGVLKNSDRFFERSPDTKQIELVERAFLSTGRYIDLLAVYRAQSNKLGLTHHASERLAWGLLRLGQEPEARDLIERLLRANPADADPWFLLGAFWLKEAASGDSRDAALKVILGWSRVLELDPNYVGFEGLKATDVQRQLSIMRRRTLPTQAELDQAEAKLKLTPTPKTPPPTTPPPTTPPTTPSPNTPANQTQDPPANAPPANTPPANTPPVSTPPAPETLAVQLGRAHLAIAEGDLSGAKRWLQRAKRAHYPKQTLEAFVARPEKSAQDAWTLVRTTWEAGDTQPASRALRALAARPNLPAAQTYQMAMFAFKKLDDRATAITLIESLKTHHAAYATSVGADALLTRIRK